MTSETSPRPTPEVDGATGKRALRNALGEERPRFLLEFPEDPELEALIAAFEAGNFAQVRREAPELARRSADEAVRQAAWELRRRTDPDPLLIVLLLLCLGLFGFLVSWVYTR
jgi:hypothetical protein